MSYISLASGLSWTNWGVGLDEFYDTEILEILGMNWLVIKAITQLHCVGRLRWQSSIHLPVVSTHCPHAASQTVTVPPFFICTSVKIEARLLDVSYCVLEKKKEGQCFPRIWWSCFKCTGVCLWEILKTKQNKTNCKRKHINSLLQFRLCSCWHFVFELGWL